MADAKTTALTELSVPDLDDLLYGVDDPGGSPVSIKTTPRRQLGLVAFTPGGRLTLTTAVPVTTSDVTAAGTLYYTPYLHNRIRLWDGTRWIVRVWAEISLALTLTSGKNYDVFMDDDGATLVLSAAWTNDTTRADALGTQDSVQVLNSDKTKLWLGTIRASGTNTCEDSLGKRFVWNLYNQVRRRVVKSVEAGHTYGTAAYRAFNNDTANKVEVLTGAAQSIVASLAGSLEPGAAIISYLGCGVDTTGATEYNLTLVSNAYPTQFQAGISSVLSHVGYHYYSINQYSSGSSTTFYLGSITIDVNG